MPFTLMIIYTFHIFESQYTTHEVLVRVIVCSLMLVLLGLWSSITQGFTVLIQLLAFH